MKTGLLIALPTGLSHGGVQSWAVRLVSSWASYDTPAAILAHGADEAVHFRGGQQLATRWPLITELSRDAALLAGPELASLATATGDDIARMLPAYVAAFEGLLAACDRLLVVPTLAGDCTGLCLAAARVLRARDSAMADRIRIAGWLHSAFPYDVAVQAHYEQGLDVLVAVSEHLTKQLQERLPTRQSDVLRAANGVLIVPDEELGDAIAASIVAAPATSIKAPREELQVTEGDAQNVLKLIYVGRLEDDVKRVGLLPLISRGLTAKGVRHVVTIVGDGPAAEQLRQAQLDSAGLLSLVLTGPKPAEAVRELLLSHDALLLVSRSEGLSLSMLEAMAAGCCPVVGATPSGASEAVTQNVTGLLVDVTNITDRERIAQTFVDVLAATPRSQFRAMGERARRACAAKYSVQKQIARLREVMDHAFAKPARTWQQHEYTFANKPSLGPDAEQRVRELLAAHPHGKLLIHGTGKHTRELAHIWTSILPQVVGFAEDDRSKAGQSLLGKPVMTPEQASQAGATHVIISSHLNQEDIWGRREVYEKQGVRVLKIYSQ